MGQNSLKYIAPLGPQTSRFNLRGKTAQTGRNIDIDGLPSIKTPNNLDVNGRNQSFKTPTNAAGNRPKLRNNLMNHQKNDSYDVPKYGNLMKLNTIDDHTMNSTEANFMNNKKYADLRLQAGKKKVIPDKYV